MRSKHSLSHVFVLSMVLLAVIALNGIVVSSSLAQERKPTQEEKQLLENVARILNRSPEKLRLLNQRTLTIPFIEATFQGVKVLDEEKDEALKVVLDNQGRQVSYQELLQQSKKTKYDRMGSLDPFLFEMAEKQPELDEIPVIIKFQFDEPRIDKSRYEVAPRLQAQRIKQDHELYKKSLVQNLSRVRTEFDKLQISTMFSLSEVSPFVSVDLSIDEINQLSRSPVVDFIGLDMEKEVYDYPTITESLPTTLTDYVHSRGYKGDGVKICILETGGLDKSESCFNIAEIQDPMAAASSHMTNSAGIIGNRYLEFYFPPFGTIEGCFGAWQGYAPEADVYIANSGSYSDRYDWAKSKGVNVITMSWHFGSEETNGTLHARDVFFDYAVTHWPYPTIFTSAGNQADPAYASGKGYNFLGVANVNNDGDGNRSNDAIASSSSWTDPTSPHNDREIPEIAAPGSRHALLGRSFGGTSCATPVAAAITTLLMDKNSSLKIWPEAIRAILLATADYQNADGANWAAALDGRDGPGLINAKYAYWTAGRRQTDTTPQYRAHDYGSLTSSSFAAGFLKEKWYAKSVGGSKSKIRVLFTWNSKTDGTTSDLDADLDLWVYSPSNTLIAVSQSWDSSYEFVEFAAPTAGTYKIKIKGYSVPSDLFTYFGVAWTAHYD